MTEQQINKKHLSQKLGFEDNKNTKTKIFQKFTIRDITFLCMMGVVALITSLIMPVALYIPVYGASQIVIGLQLAIFPTIALIKVRKVGSFTFTMFIVLLYSVVKTPLTFAFNLIIVLILETLVIVIFRGYKNLIPIFFVVTLFNALTLPFTWLVQNIIMNTPGHWDQYAINQPWLAGIMAGVILLISFAGCWLGVIISKELIKAGLFSKWDKKKASWTDEDKVEDSTSNKEEDNDVWK
ncbi:MAG: hypothetical protein ACRC42_01790 [Mycoplasma sp.]